MSLRIGTSACVFWIRVFCLYADAPEMAELGLIAPLGNILSQLSQGGGAKGINIDAVSFLAQASLSTLKAA